MYATSENRVQQNTVVVVNVIPQGGISQQNESLSAFAEFKPLNSTLPENQRQATGLDWAMGEVEGEFIITNSFYARSWSSEFVLRVFSEKL